MPKSANRERRFVYGPVPSRRLGFSLGIDILPYKTCSLDCVYCQLGSAGRTTCRRRSYFSARRILAQTREAIKSGRRIDVITFSGSGEPTLNANLGPVMRGIKRMTHIPVAVLTNGTLLTRKAVRRDLLAADIVVPSLDAARTAVFQKVNRPHRSLAADKIVRGLVQFRKEFKGQIWLEVMLVKGVNDSPADIRDLKAAAAAINPDRIHLNTVVRPPAESWAGPLSAKELERVRRALGPKAEVVAAFSRKSASSRPQRGLSLSRMKAGLEGDIAALVRRRPVTAEDISLSLGRPGPDVLKAVRSLVELGRIRAVSHGRRTFYEPAG